MRAIVVNEPGGVEVLKLKDVDIPEPKPGQLRIKVAYSGLNFFEVLTRSGRYLRKPRYPIILGGEVSGVVDKLGEDVAQFKLGQRVAGLTGGGGGYADYALADAGGVIPLPDSMDLKLAAAYPLQVLTAHGVLHISGRAKAGEWVLIHAAAGGVGTALCQLARLAGCQVIGTAGSAEKCEHAKNFGAQWMINYNEQRFWHDVRKITGGHGADLICDSVGLDVQSDNMRSIAHFGRVVVFGYASGAPKYSMDVLWGRSAGVSTYGLYHHVADATLTKMSVEATLPAVVSGELKIPLGSVYALEDGAQAHQAMEGRKVIGKLLLEVDAGVGGA